MISVSERQKQARPTTNLTNRNPPPAARHGSTHIIISYKPKITRRDSNPQKTHIHEYCTGTHPPNRGCSFENQTKPKSNIHGKNPGAKMHNLQSDDLHYNRTACGCPDFSFLPVSLSLLASLMPCLGRPHHSPLRLSLHTARLHRRRPQYTPLTPKCCYTGGRPSYSPRGEAAVVPLSTDHNLA